MATTSRFQKYKNYFILGLLGVFVPFYFPVVVLIGWDYYNKKKGMNYFIAFLWWLLGTAIIIGVILGIFFGVKALKDKKSSTVYKYLDSPEYQKTGDTNVVIMTAIRKIVFKM